MTPRCCSLVPRLALCCLTLAPAAAARAQDTVPPPLPAAGVPAPERVAWFARFQDSRSGPEATETISYGVPAFQVEGKAVAGFAFFKAHCSYFPHSSTVLSAMGDAVDGYETSKGTIKFGIDTPLPRALVERLVATRLLEIR